MIDIYSWPTPNGHKIHMEFPHAQRWFDAINARPAVQRALQVLSDVNHTAPHDEKSRDILFGKTQFARR